MTTQIQGRHSVDFRTHPSKKTLPMVRNTASSQSNKRRGSKNTKPRSTQIQISKKQKPCNNISINQLLQTVIRLQKQKSIFGSNLDEVSRITKVIKQLTSAPISLCQRLLRVIATKQLSSLFPQIADLVISILNLLHDSRGQAQINRIIQTDIQNLQKQLKSLKQEQKLIQKSYQQQKESRNSKISSLLQTIRLQNIQLQSLKNKHLQNLEETKHKLSNNRYK